TLRRLLLTVSLLPYTTLFRSFCCTRTTHPPGSRRASTSLTAEAATLSSLSSRSSGARLGSRTLAGSSPPPSAPARSVPPPMATAASTARTQLHLFTRPAPPFRGRRRLARYRS